MWGVPYRRGVFVLINRAHLGRNKVSLIEGMSLHQGWPLLSRGSTAVFIGGIVVLRQYLYVIHSTLVNWLPPLYKGQNFIPQLWPPYQKYLTRSWKENLYDLERIFHEIHARLLPENGTNLAKSYICILQDYVWILYSLMCVSCMIMCSSW